MTTTPRSPTTTVRHSGRALVRGKIRRIWRPRYLELCDNGLVKYYELTEDQPHHQQTTHPKCTIAVIHARIIDVTTLRDMHVGLPIASFGFVFYGQRLSAAAIHHHHHTPDSLLEACHPSSGDPNPPPRDFLCAVDTLEEAQSWVVALQWASQRIVELSTTTNNNNWSGVFDDDEEEEWEDADFTSSTVVHASSSSKKKKRAGKDAFQVIDDRHVQQQQSSSSSKRNKSSSSQRKPGKIVVTRVGPLKLIRSQPLSFDLAYQIAVLLIQQKENESVFVEERTMLRTPEDIRAMLEALQQELDSSNERNNKSRTAISSARRVLKRVRGTVEEYVPSTAPYSYSRMASSLSHVDGCLRTLAMNGIICNSTSMRQFWSLSESTGRQHIWVIHTGSGLYWQRHLEAPENTEEFVKDWLQKESTKTQAGPVLGALAGVAVWILQHPSIVIGGMAVFVLLLPPAITLYEASMVSMEIRLDVLLASWIVSTFVGRLFERLYPGMKFVSSEREDGLGAVHLPREVEIMAKSSDEAEELLFDVQSATTEEEEEGPDEFLEEGEIGLESEYTMARKEGVLSSPLPQHPENGGVSCWSKPPDDIFHVRGHNYLNDRIKIPSAPAPFVCRGVDLWLTDNAERHIARHPSVLGGKLGEEDTFLVNFLLPFGNFVAYFSIPPVEQFPPKLANVWTKFLQGDQEYRDARLKLLPIVVDGPWIVRTAVGPGSSPALLGKVIPLQYYFRSPSEDVKAAYEVDVIITASRIAKGILSVVKGHTKTLTIAFALIIEAAEEADLPETVLSTFQMHSIHLEDCPRLPECNLDEIQ